MDARELWEFLSLCEQFGNWVQRQIERVRLEENRSYMGYVSFKENIKREVGSSVRTEYHFTLDAAKHVAMITGTDKGFEVRDYFIACEKKALAVAAALPTDPIMAMVQVVQQLRQDQITQQQEQLQKHGL